MTLPERPRPRISPPARALVASLREVAALATWRALHPVAREVFVEPPPPPVERVPFRAVDGESGALLFHGGAAGGAREPVLLVAGAGFRPEIFCVGGARSLVSRLGDAGFSVYLLEHRGERGLPWDLDTLGGLDLPPALDAAAIHAGHRRVHLMGHGLGGSACLFAVGAAPERVASLSLFAAPVGFPRLEDEPSFRRAVHWIFEALPLPGGLPVRALGKAAAPFWGDESVEGWFDASATAGPRRRAVARWAVDDVPLALLRQVARCHRHGVLVGAGDVEVAEALPAALPPLWTVCGAGDGFCAPDQAAPVHALWPAGESQSITLGEAWGHVDLVVSQHDAVVEPWITFLSQHRRRTWHDASGRLFAQGGS